MLIKASRRLSQEVKGLMQYIFQEKSPLMEMEKMNYDEYWLLRGRHSAQPRYKIFCEFIEEGASVMDIGCGDGTALKYLQKGRNIRAYGVDISREAVRLAQEIGINATVGDITSPSFTLSKVYDYILLTEVLEHLTSPEEVIQKVKHHFNKLLVISIPNIGYYQHRLRLLLGRFPIQWGWHPSEHLRFWTVKDFLHWSRSLGLTIVAVKSSNGFPLLHRRFPNLLGNQIVFILKNTTEFN